MKVKTVVGLAAVVLSMPAASARAQDAGNDEPTLPPVIVRPGEQPEQQPSPADQTLPGPAAGAPPETPTPDAGATPEPGDLPAAPAPSALGAAAQAQASAFPSLSNLTLGGEGPFNANRGILRDATSLWDTPAAASIRTRQEILERQAPDMFHALQNEVGVLLQSTAAGQASPFIRGLTGQQVLILVDGIRLNNSITRRGPNQYFNTIDAGMVDHIEVLRGQGSVLWGADAIGGVINVVSRSPTVHDPSCAGYAQREFTQYFNTANSAPYSRMNVEGWVGRAGVFGGASYLNVRDLDTGFDRFGRQPGTNYQQYAGDIKFNYLLSDRSLLTVSLQHFEQEDLPRSDRFPGYPFDRNNSNTPAGARFFDPQQRDLAYLRHQILEPAGGLLDASTFTASYHRQREVQTRGIPTTRSQETDVDTTGLNWVGSRRLGSLGKIVTGVDWYYDDVDSDFSGAASGPIVPDDAWYRRAGWFANWNMPLTSRLKGVLGTRFESVETAGSPVINDEPNFIKQSYEDWIASGGLIYQVRPGLRLVGSIAEGYRPPNLDDLMANNPNVQQEGQSVPSLGLVAENSITYEIGAKINTPKLRAQSFVYWIDLKDNLASITAAPNTFATANQDAYLNGFETDGEYLLTDFWSLYGNFWYTYGQNEETNAPLSRIPPMQGILGMRYRDAATGHYFTFYSWLSDGQDRLDPVRDISDERIPPGGTPAFATLNMRMGKTFGRRDQHRASLSLENMTDADYLVHGSGVLGTGITARFGWSSLF